MNDMIRSHAELELSLLAKTVPDAIVTPFSKEIAALYDAVMASGQSGGSMPYTAKAVSQAVEALLMQRVICPLTGEDDEWVDITDINDGEPMFQNNRDSRVFKEGERGRAYFTDAIVFDGDIGGRFTGNGSVKHKDDTISSFQYIKEFPFTPKTFYVDVIGHRWKDKNETVSDENGDWWSHTIADEKQLEAVFEYYDRRQSQNG